MSRKSKTRRVDRAELAAIAGMFPEEVPMRRQAEDRDEGKEPLYGDRIKLGSDMHSGKSVDLRY